MPKDKLDIFHISLFVSRIKPQGAENSKENRKKTNFLLGAGAGVGAGAGAGAGADQKSDRLHTTAKNE